MADSIVLVGSETLLGREVREVLGATELGEHLQLMAGAREAATKDEEELTVLTSVGDEPGIIGQLNPDALQDAAVVILAGSARSSEKALKGAPSGMIVDLTFTTEDDPAARVRAPYLFRDFGDDDDTGGTDGPQISAHPAAIAIAVVLRRLHAAFPIARSLVHVFEPASERGTPGIEELQQQTVSLLSFKPIPKKIFDTQIAYTLLTQLGEDSAVSLVTIEERIERHLASLLERLDGVPMPSLRLIQAPVFHGTSFSFWIEFEEAPTASDIEDVMNSEPFDLRTADVEPPNNVGVAGHSGISVGAITPDRNSAGSFWIWAAIDNLRLTAENAALITRDAL